MWSFPRSSYLPSTPCLVTARLGYHSDSNKSPHVCRWCRLLSVSPSHSFSFSPLSPFFPSPPPFHSELSVLQSSYDSGVPHQCYGVTMETLTRTPWANDIRPMNIFIYTSDNKITNPLKELSLCREIRFWPWIGGNGLQKKTIKAPSPGTNTSSSSLLRTSLN